MSINPNCPNCKTHNQVFSTDIIAEFSKKYWATKSKKWHCNKCDVQFNDERMVINVKTDKPLTLQELKLMALRYDKIRSTITLDEFLKDKIKAYDSEKISHIQRVLEELRVE